MGQCALSVHLELSSVKMAFVSYLILLALHLTRAMECACHVTLVMLQSTENAKLTNPIYSQTLTALNSRVNYV
jgi:hypothetical protein